MKNQVIADMILLRHSVARLGITTDHGERMRICGAMATEITRIDAFISRRGNVSQGSQIQDRCRELAQSGQAIIYLNDGGYSRLLIDATGASGRMWLTDSSLDSTRQRWDVLELAAEVYEETSGYEEPDAQRMGIWRLFETRLPEGFTLDAGYYGQDLSS